VRRLAIVAALVAGLASFAVPASAALGGECDGKVDVACREHGCVPDLPCNVEICVVWSGQECEVG